MGDIIKNFQARSATGEKPRLLKFYFDTGSPRTFVKKSAALDMKDVAKLSAPVIFSGLGNGRFEATHIVSLRLKLLGIWVPHLCYVVPDEVLDPEYDVLLGHDFMQIYDIRVRPRQKDVAIRRNALKMALKGRSVYTTAKSTRHEVRLRLVV